MSKEPSKREKMAAPAVAPPIAPSTPSGPAPVPYKVTSTVTGSAAPKGAMPITLYGVVISPADIPVDVPGLNGVTLQQVLGDIATRLAGLE